MLREVRVCSMNRPRQILKSYGHSDRAAFWERHLLNAKSGILAKPSDGLFLTLLNPRMHTQNHTPIVVQGEGRWIKPLHGVFDMWQYFQTILTLEESL